MWLLFHSYDFLRYHFKIEPEEKPQWPCYPLEVYFSQYTVQNLVKQKTFREIFLIFLEMNGLC